MAFELKALLVAAVCSLGVAGSSLSGCSPARPPPSVSTEHAQEPPRAGEAPKEGDSSPSIPESAPAPRVRVRPLAQGTPLTSPPRDHESLAGSDPVELAASESDSSEGEAFKTDVELVNRAVRNLGWGNIVFSSPARAQLDESSLVELALSPSLPIAELETALRQRASTDGASIRISNRMRALLTADDGLAVTSQSEALQAVSGLSPTHWSWRVKAVKEGKQSLHLALYAQILVNGVETGYEVRTFQRTIEVEVMLATRALQFAGANWQWLWTVLLLPGLSLIWRLRPQRAREARPLGSGEV